MDYARHTSAPPLSNFVDYLWFLKDGPPHKTERILPGGTTELVINLSDNEIRIEDRERQQFLLRLSGAVVSGPYRHYFDIDARRHADMLGVHFKPGGAQSFLAAPSGELLDAHVDLEQLWGAGADRLRTRACEASSPEACFATLESELMSRFRPDRIQPPFVAEAVVTLAPGTSHPPIGDLAERTGLSHRKFIQAFRTSIGMSPKQFSRVRRFQRTLTGIGFTEPPRWSEFAVACGYADQSHMIREFQSFSGLTPVQHLNCRPFATKDDHLALVA